MVQLPADLNAAVYLKDGAALIAEHGGKTLANASAAEVECLESGTPAAAILLAEFEQPQSIEAFWSDSQHQAMFPRRSGIPEVVALSVAGLPYMGLPDAMEIPTIASVAPPESEHPCAYMIVQGSSTDQARMDQYRDIILPMIKAQGAYYTAFEIEGNVNLLSGEWPHEIFAISRWPDHESGHAFWDSDRYQNTAIPIRTGVGHFLVHYFSGAVARSMNS